MEDVPSLFCQEGKVETAEASKAQTTLVFTSTHATPLHPLNFGLPLSRTPPELPTKLVQPLGDGLREEKNAHSIGGNGLQH